MLFVTTQQLLLPAVVIGRPCRDGGDQPAFDRRCLVGGGDTLADRLVGPLYHRAPVTGHKITKVFVARLVTATLGNV
jgi:hypothetical protein